MDTVRSYRRLALDCLKVAAKTQDADTREDMTRLAQLWERLASEASKPSHPASGREQAA